MVWTPIANLTGPAVELQESGAYVQWRVAGSGSAWTNLLPLSDIQGLPGVNAVANDTATAGYIVAGGGSLTQTAGDNRWGAFLNVMSFGAVGDGATDDTAAINAAIQATPAGGTTYLPVGHTFMVDADYGSGGSGHTGSIIPKAGVTIRVDGVLKALPSSNATTAVIYGSSRVSDWSVTGAGTISGERLTHIGSTGEFGIGIQVDGGARVNISGVTVRDTWGDGIYIGLDNSTANTEADSIRISNVLLKNCRRNGASVTGGKSVTFTGCTINDTNGTAPQAGIDLEPNGSSTVTNITVVGCTFYNNLAAGVIAATGAMNVTISGNVFAGTHTNAAIQCNAAFSTVSGNTISAGSVIGIYGAGGADIAVVGNNIRGTTSYGIRLLNGCHGATVSGNVVSDTAAEGIIVSGSNTFAITGNTANRVGSTASAAISAGWSTTFGGGSGVISGNTITDSAKSGIAVSAPNVLVTGNMIVGASASATNTFYGIYVAANTATGLTISNNCLRPGITSTAQVKWGIYLVAGANNAILDGNDFLGAVGTLEVNDAATGTLQGRQRNNAGAIAEGFFGTAPSTRNAAAAAATDLASVLTLANGIRTELCAKGLLS